MNNVHTNAVVVFASGDRTFMNALVGGLFILCILLPLGGLVLFWLRNR